MPDQRFVSQGVDLRGLEELECFRLGYFMFCFTRCPPVLGIWITCASTLHSQEDNTNKTNVTDNELHLLSAASHVE